MAKRDAGSIAGLMSAVVAALAGVVLAVVHFAPGGTIAGTGTSAPPPPDSRVAQIYLAVLGYHAFGGREYVIDRACGDVARSPSLDCTGPALSKAVQARIRAALGPSVRFGTNPPDPVTTRTVVIGFGPLTVTGHRARLAMEIQCGPLCGNGATYQLARRGGHWQVTGQTGPSWIS